MEITSQDIVTVGVAINELFTAFIKESANSTHTTTEKIAIFYGSVLFFDDKVNSFDISGKKARALTGISQQDLKGLLIDSVPLKKDLDIDVPPEIILSYASYNALIDLSLSLVENFISRKA